MKKVSMKAVLSLLLFAFCMYSAHDYLIDIADPDTQYELYYAQTGKMTLDTPSELHDHIHFLFDIPAQPQQIILALQNDMRPETIISKLHSYIGSLQPRPPLS